MVNSIKWFHTTPDNSTTTHIKVGTIISDNDQKTTAPVIVQLGRKFKSQVQGLKQNELENAF